MNDKIFLEPKTIAISICEKKEVLAAESDHGKEIILSGSSDAELAAEHSEANTEFLTKKF